MKKQIIDFQKVQYRRTYLPKISSRLTGQNVAYKSDGDEDDGEDGEEEREKLLKTIEKRTKKLIGDRASKTDVDAIAKQLTFLTKGKNEKGEEVDSPFPIEMLREMADPKNGAMAKLVEMGLKIKTLETEREKQPKDMSTRGQVERWMEANKEGIAKLKSGQRNVNLSEMTLRTASPMLVSTVNSGSSPYIGKTEIEAGVNPILQYQNTFWDFLTKGRTSGLTYVWVNMTNPLGAAAFTGPGVAKPGISFELVAETSVAKKITDSAKAGMELLFDIEGMVSFIEDELKRQLMLKVNTTLMTGAVSSTVPAGIQTLSQTFAFYTGAQTNFPSAAAAGLKTTNPTYMDAVRAVIGALRSGYIQGAITVFINPVDSANMDMAKASDSGVYLLPPFVTADGRNIAGCRVVEDQNIPVGYIQAGFLEYYRIKIYQDFSVQWGWENDDFTHNLTTAVYEMRLHQMFNTKYTGAFLYDTFANVIAAITAV